MADDLFNALGRFHRDVLMPDVKEAFRKFEQRLRDTTLSHFDTIYRRFNRLEVEYHALAAAVGRIERLLTVRRPGLLVAALVSLSAASLPLSSQPREVTIHASHLSTDDCQAYVVNADGDEDSAPCGVAMTPGFDAAFAWIETSRSITPFRTDVSDGREFRIDTLVPSATIAFPATRRLRAGERIRLVSLVPPRDAQTLRNLFYRDVTSSISRVRMPAGRVVLLHMDAKGRVVAASPPLPIQADREHVLWPEDDASSATVVAWLARPRPIANGRDDEVALELADLTDRHSPDASVNAADAVFAVWYGLEGTEARLHLTSPDLWLRSDTSTISRGSVTTMEATLHLLPSLTVAVGPLPEHLNSLAPMKLTIASAVDEERELRTIDVEPGQTVKLARLPVELLAVDLLIGDVRLRTRANLSSGEDSSVFIPLEPIVISGTVLVGDTPARATLRFLQKGKPIVVETDDRGAYELTLWQSQRYVLETTAAGRNAAYSELVDIESSGTIDIHIPANVLTARVYDAANGEPLERAEILIQSRWTDASGTSSSVATVIATGRETELPPLRIGEAEIRVRARGYADFGPVRVRVSEGTRELSVEAPMTRGSEEKSLQILLDGMPAAHAEMASWSGEQMIWRATSDASGFIRIPRNGGSARVIVRHPEAASDVVLLGTTGAGDTLSLTRAAPPLAIRVVRRNGKKVGPRAVRITRVGGVRLTGPELAFATWSTGATSPDGTFVARGLPPRPLRLFATDHATAQQIGTGTFDGLAKLIPYPWPVLADVTLVDD